MVTSLAEGGFIAAHHGGEGCHLQAEFQDMEASVKGFVVVVCLCVELAALNVRCCGSGAGWSARCTMLVSSAAWSESRFRMPTPSAAKSGLVVPRVRESAVVSCSVGEASSAARSRAAGLWVGLNLSLVSCASSDLV